MNTSNGTNGRNIVNGRTTSKGRNTVMNIIIGITNNSGSTDSTGSNSRKSAKGSTMSGISFGSRTCFSSVNFDNEVLSKLSSKIFLAKSITSPASYFSPFKYREKCESEKSDTNGSMGKSMSNKFSSPSLSSFRAFVWTSIAASYHFFELAKKLSMSIFLE